MGMGNCDGCWDSACGRKDGRGWRGYDRRSLLDIRAAIDAALAGPLCGAALPGGDVCTEAVGHGTWCRGRGDWVPGHKGNGARHG